MEHSALSFAYLYFHLHHFISRRKLSLAVFTAPRLLDRFRQFNPHQLRRVACKTVGATNCVFIEKIGEGGFNKVFRLLMQDEQKVIAKIPHPNSGPRCFTTASEVATMDFCRTVLDMRHADTGPFFFKITGVPEVQPIKITSDLAQEAKNDIERRFSIGPSVQRKLWAKERTNMSKYHGPCTNSTVTCQSDEATDSSLLGTSPTDYLKSLAGCEVDWLSKYASGNVNDQRSPQAHIDLLEKFISIIPLITPKEDEIVSARLWHPDFHAGNIFIDKTGMITSLIDWQGALIGPIFISANPPKVLDYSIDLLMELPDNYKQLEEDRKAKLRRQVSQLILIEAYETRSASQNPLMYRLMRYPNSKTLKELVAFVSGS
ncbi:hypothetical protein EJ04DRAFT_546854 [Polyplosphaeria fusca]|uniref:Altered inheritance of mitochondria protein 9, mitochondrial n=1 Tax=Polyplosphaeria fusca TaxID=682080 RepID=A0A9P4QJ78_9PLEO|nr:hypothetical protein EJ04DRAFT_546854 [Polyplosphaeria fusca]